MNTENQRRVLGWVDFGHFFLRPNWGSANDLYEYNTPMDDLKFILSFKTTESGTFVRFTKSRS